MSKKYTLAGLLFGGAMMLASPANALFCSDDGARFEEWKAAFKKEYAGKFSPATMKKLDGVQYSTVVIKQDRTNRKGFSGDFNSFYKRRTQGVVSGARARINTYKRYFDKAERQFGVPPEIIAAVWGLETGFGSYKGKQYPILQSVATLAYDCRRSEKLFFKEFMAAMTVTDRRIYDLSKATGAWAGELGQTQMLPDGFLIGATDYDGGGVDVFHSVPDVIGTTAKWFAAKGWQRGAGYGEGEANYSVIAEWNHAQIYQKTISRVAGEIANR